MSARTGNDRVRSVKQGVVELQGTVTFGSAAIASQDTPGFTVTRDGVGTFTVTFDEKYPEIVALSDFWFTQGTESGLKFEADVDYVASTGVLSIVSTVDATATEPLTGDKVYLEIKVLSSDAGL